MPHITDPNEPYFKDGVWGWDGAAWRRLNLLFGYHAPYSEYIAVNNVPAGNYDMHFSVVPAGEVWVITALYAICNQALADGIVFSPTIGGTTVSLVQHKPAAASIGFNWSGWLTLRQGDFARFVFCTCALNDDVRGSVAGYKMLITA